MNLILIQGQVQMLQNFMSVRSVLYYKNKNTAEIEVDAYTQVFSHAPICTSPISIWYLF